MNIIDICNVGYVRDVGHIAYVGDVDHAQVVAPIVVPGKEWLARSQRKPTYEVHVYSDCEARASQERHHSWRKNW